MPVQQLRQRAEAGKGPIGASSSFGVCKSATPDGRIVCLLKTLLTNKCIHDCKYCENAVPGPRAEFEPQELAKLFMGFICRTAWKVCSSVPVFAGMRIGPPSG